jgi:hypothetical protein
LTNINFCPAEVKILLPGYECMRKQEDLILYTAPNIPLII